MRRRRRLTILALVTFLIVFIWAISAWLSWGWASTPRGPQRSQVSVRIHHGVLDLGHVRRLPTARPYRCEPGIDCRVWSGLDYDTLPEIRWRPYAGSGAAGPQRATGATLPLWLLWAPLSALLVYCLVRRTGPGMCRRCGYPTRGLPSPVCPECGRRLDQASQA
ncbi:MAG: hypothetical protein SYC29_18355 [Planctomycetota bacterium]|nr:hypothetical protein [Planctomycetota bacterium]